MMMKDRICKKVSLILIFLIIGSILFPSIKGNWESKDDLIYVNYENSSIDQHFNKDKHCYGYIIPILSKDNMPRTSIQQATSNLINDLLRMDSSVYWCTEDVSVLGKSLDNNTVSNYFFNKGSIIVPFTNNISKDVMISCIIRDYHGRSEIEQLYGVDVFYLLESIELDVFELTPVKAAYYNSDKVNFMLLNCYLDILLSGGFFDNEILSDHEISDTLDNANFNLFIWPGANTQKTFKIYLKSALNPKVSKTIRDFVDNGGAYIGSCYGALQAASGLLVPTNIMQHYVRFLPALIYLSLSDSSVSMLPFSGEITDEFVDMDHPVSFGLNKTETSFYGQGPFFLWLGKNTKPIAVAKEISIDWLEKEGNGIKSNIIEKLVNAHIGRPIWVESTYGDGKLVVFGDHPELYDPTRLDRLIHNAIFFTTGQKIVHKKIENTRDVDFIHSVFTFSSEIPIKNDTASFQDVDNKTKELDQLCSKVDSVHDSLINCLFQLYSQGKIDTDTYTYAITEYRCSYQYFVTLFSDSLLKLKQVYATVSDTFDVSSSLSIWNSEIHSLLDKCRSCCLSAVSLNQLLVEQLENYTFSIDKKMDLLKTAKAYNSHFKQGYNDFIDLYQITTKLYRTLWYDYETNVCLQIIDDQVITESLSLNLSSKASFNYEYRNRWIVDAKFPAGGNGSVLFPFNKINDAVEASSDGDVIFVKRGIYKEQFTIYKSVTLIGEDKRTTIIEGMKKLWHMIIIRAPGVEISGFTIRNSSVITAGCGIIIQSNNNTINDTIIVDNRIGIGFRPGSCNNVIKNNLIVNNSFMGVILDESTSIHNVIKDNFFINNNHFGLYLFNNLNHIDNNSLHHDGIYVMPSDNPLHIDFHNNTIDDKPVLVKQNCKDMTINQTYGQIILSSCKHIVIENVSITDKNNGISILSSSHITIDHCNLSDNTFGIILHNSTEITITNSIINDNEFAGIHFVNTKDTEICNNKIYNNHEGIYLDHSSDNLIENNQISMNGIGISIWFKSTKNKIRENNLINNNEHVFDQCSNKYWKNYWDDSETVLKSRLMKPYNVPPRKIMNIDWKPLNNPIHLSYHKKTGVGGFFS